MQKRVSALDGLRVIAILMVMLYHYYHRFEGKYYSFNGSAPDIFKYGYLGVELFFIISGFVITLTLEKCASLNEFIKKRFVRLIPGMLVCSSITFLIFNLVSSSGMFENSKSLANLLVSNTFFSPAILNRLFGSNLNYVDGVYWSLWVEIQFYFAAGILYFMAPRLFVRNYLVFGLLSFCLVLTLNNQASSKLLMQYFGTRPVEVLRDFINVIQLFRFNIWFVLGIFINKLHYHSEKSYDKLILISLFLLQIFLCKGIEERIFVFALMIVFFAFLYYPKGLRILENKVFAKVGMASYSIYLIHQNIGVLAINRFSGDIFLTKLIFPCLMILVFSLFGILSLKYLENPIAKYLKHFFIPSKNITNKYICK